MPVAAMLFLQLAFYYAILTSIKMQGYLKDI